MISKKEKQKKEKKRKQKLCGASGVEKNVRKMTVVTAATRYC